MSSIKIENFRGIKKAEFELSKIVLVAAPNASGKSAIAQAVGAVLSGTTVPIPGIPKTLAGILVRGGSATGSALMVDGEDSARVDWPKCTYKTKGEPMQISQYAAGILTLTPIGHDSPDQQKARTTAFIDMLGATPTHQDVRSAFDEQGLAETVADAVWTGIERQGFDAAHAQAKETGARLKGQWEGISGERYGSAKAASFVPPAWDHELENESIESLNAKLTDARDSLDSMIAIVAVDDAERDRLYESANKLDALREGLAIAQKGGETIRQEAQKAADAVRALKKPGTTGAVCACPHCAKEIEIVGATARIPAAITPEEIAAYEAAVKAAEDAAAELATAREGFQHHQQAIARAEADAQQLEKLGQGNATAEQIEKARSAVRYAEERLSAFTKKDKADRLQVSITQNAEIIRLLDPAGIRLQKLDSSLRDFFSLVNNECRGLGWEEIGIDDMAYTYGGRPWQVLSESERFRVRVAVQIATAITLRNNAVIIDAADILDSIGRNGLIGVLREIEKKGISSLICMTIPTLDKVPDLDAKGMGQSFWINSGELQPLKIATH